LDHESSEKPPKMGSFGKNQSTEWLRLESNPSRPTTERWLRFVKTEIRKWLRLATNNRLSKTHQVVKEHGARNSPRKEHRNHKPYQFVEVDGHRGG
jgi:hypothetical protein